MLTDLPNLTGKRIHLLPFVPGTENVTVSARHENQTVRDRMMEAARTLREKGNQLLFPEFTPHAAALDLDGEGYELNDFSVRFRVLKETNPPTADEIRQYFRDEEIALPRRARFYAWTPIRILMRFLEFFQFTQKTEFNIDSFQKVRKRHVQALQPAGFFQSRLGVEERLTIRRPAA